jgi:hypothetical protein
MPGLALAVQFQNREVLDGRLARVSATLSGTTPAITSVYVLTGMKQA